jgi:hypothetical protein
MRTVPRRGKALDMDQPFLRPESRRYADILTDATVHILAEDGIDRFSVRAIARWMKVRPSTVLGEYPRARVLELVLIAFEKRWLAWSAAAGRRAGDMECVPLRMPSTPEERDGVRVHSALEHLAEAEALRKNPIPLRHLERLHAAERTLLKLRLRQDCCSVEPAGGSVDVLMALIRGLRRDLALEPPRISLEAALDAVRQEVARIAVHAPDCDRDGRLAS